MQKTRLTLACAAAATGAAAFALAAGTGGSVTSAATAATGTPSPPKVVVGGVLRSRPHAARVGTRVGVSTLFSSRVFFTDTADGFALAGGNDAQYPARTTNGGRTWRIDGPQFHIDAADGPEGVGYVGVASRRTLFAYGSSVVDVTTNAGHTWYEAYLGELVVAVVPGPHDELVAYVQQQRSNNHISPVDTWQYVSKDGGRRWRYSTALGGI